MKKGTAIWSQAYYKKTNALNILIKLIFEYYMKYPRSVKQRLNSDFIDYFSRAESTCLLPRR